MSKIEILAPVGNEEMLRAAVFSGADAVYLGFSGFNARTSANNFNADTLKDAVAFCHARGVAVHVALNTTVYGGELPALEQAIRAVAASGADAVICQDLAVATLIGKIAPQLPRHGSTQMSVHSLQGALELKELGFTRVVLARELSMPEVEHITKHCGIETECFVHGALRFEEHRPCGYLRFVIVRAFVYQTLGFAAGRQRNACFASSRYAFLVYLRRKERLVRLLRIRRSAIFAGSVHHSPRAVPSGLPRRIFDGGTCGRSEKREHQIAAA